MSQLQVTIKRLESEADTQQSYCCMTEVPTPWAESLCLCREWIAHNLGTHVEGYHAQTRDGRVIGHLYYAASERALFPYRVEPGAAVLYCEWVQRQHQGQGVAHRLFDTFVSDLWQRNCKGVLVEATDLEGQMDYHHYLGRGFRLVHEFGHRKLLHLPMTQPTLSAQPLPPKIKPRHGAPVEVLIVAGYLCPLDVSTHIALQQVVQEFGAQVILRQEPLTPETLERYGVGGGIFINGKPKLSGAETEQAIRQAILEEL